MKKDPSHLSRMERDFAVTIMSHMGLFSPRAASRPAPFIKWVGGKRQLLGELLNNVPAKFNSYHEPFLGGGALFFELAARGLLKGKAVYLSDINEELINTYIQVRDNVEELIKYLKKHRYEEAYFYRIRKKDPAWLNDIARAARFIFLNKTCFNGLYRVNKAGEFNVPFGRYSNPKICDEAGLRACCLALQGVTISCSRFWPILTQAVSRRAFIYFDPPYWPVSKTANFAAFDKEGFGRLESEALAACFNHFSRRRSKIMLSNSSTAFTRSLFKGHRIRSIKARRAVNSNAESRGKVNEILVMNYPKK